MEIQSVLLGKSIPVSHIVKAKYTSSKIALPVKKSQYLYSNFKHITGIPASADGKGLSLMKLKALDNLIDRLGKLGKNPGNETVGKSLNSEKLNGLIDTYSMELHRLVSFATPYTNIGVENGLLVNMTA